MLNIRDLFESFAFVSLCISSLIETMVHIKLDMISEQLQSSLIFPA